MSEYLPYIVSVVCALVSGITSYLVARKQTKADIQNLEKQYELDLDKEREKFAMEKEKMELEHQYQLELKMKEMMNQMGTDMVSTITKEYLRTPAGQAQISNAGTKKHHN